MKWHKIFLFDKIAVPTIPKVAISSIQHSFQIQGYQPVGMSHMTLDQLGDRRILVLTRNPFDRLVSLYHNKIKKPEALLSNDVSLEQFGFYRDMPFPDFVRAVSKVPDDDSDRHFRSQVELLTVEGEFIADDSWDLSDIDSFWVTIKTYVNVRDLPHKNKSRNRKRDYREYYDDELRELVEARYASDIAQFGYTF